MPFKIKMPGSCNPDELAFFKADPDYNYRAIFYCLLLKIILDECVGL